MKEKQQQLNIAISGAGGLIGKTLCSYLLENTEHFLILSYLDTAHIPSEILNHKRCRCVVGDLVEESICVDLLENADVLIHLAQNVGPKINSGKWLDACKNSCDSTFKMLDTLRNRTSPLHILYPSSGGTVYSSKITNNLDEKIPYNEKTPVFAVSPYGIQKVMFENYFSLLTTINPNISVNVLRITNPYGTLLPSSRAQGFIGIAASKIKNNEVVEIWGNPDSVRDYIYMDDLNRAINAAVHYREGFQIINIGAGVGTSLVEIISVFEKYLQKNIDYKVVPVKDENYFPDWVVLDNSKAKEKLNWEPLISIEEGIKNVLKQI